MRGPGIHDDDDIQSRHEHDGDELRESNASRGAFSDSRGPAGSRPSAGAADGQRLPHHSEGLGECGGSSVSGDGNGNHVNQGESTLVQALRFQGPLPPPQILAGCKEIDASYAERIFVMAERSHEVEVAATQAQTEYQHQNTKLVKLGTAVGIWTHAAVTVTCLGIVIFAILSGHWAVAGIGAVLPLAEGAVRLVQAMQEPNRP